MKVKRYKGDSLERIREVIFKEFGENAVIVNIQKIRVPGILPIGGKYSYEVVAAVDEAVLANSVSLDDLTGANLENLLSVQKEQYINIRKSMKLLDDKLVDVNERIETLRIIGGKDSTISDEKTIPDNLSCIHEEWRLKLLNDLPEITAPNFDNILHKELSSLITTASGILFRKTKDKKPDVYIFIGTTGVGKTTTLAKLAAKCVLGKHLNVGIISIDTFRIAAVEQLREYSALLGVEMAVAFSAKELKNQIDKYHEKDVIFIDTPGKGQFDTSGIENIKECLTETSGLCSIMVIPANIREEEAKQICENFSPLEPSAFIISKTDESMICDGLTRLFSESKLPALYLTDGQRVPEDIHIASPGVIASLVLSSNNYNSSFKNTRKASDESKSRSSSIAEECRQK